ncbi:MAG: hypothetical protein V5783_07115 [Pontiella sp.]
MKTTTTYWNPLADVGSWEAIAGTNGQMRQITLAEDAATGDYTRLTWFRDGYSSEAFGPKSHAYPEEIFIVSGRIYDEAFDRWLEPGMYASRPAGEVHGPFRAAGDAVVLEVSFPGPAKMPDLFANRA